MAVSWTIPGGHHSVLSLNPHEYAAAHNALAMLRGEFHHESVQAGMGHATMLGGGEGHGFTDFAVRYGHPTVPGAQHNVFDFHTSPDHGAPLNTDFTHGRDPFQLATYDTTTAFGHDTHHGGAILSLDGGKTEIVLNGFHNLHKG